MRYQVSDKTEKMLGREMYFVIDSTTGQKVTKPAGIMDGCYALAASAQKVADKLNEGAK
jgi:hypothetical protein